MILKASIMMFPRSHSFGSIVDVASIRKGRKTLLIGGGLLYVSDRRLGSALYCRWPVLK